MNSFQRKALYTALAGVSGLGATTAADAVNVNAGGLGQVLLYPYYTVRADANGNAYNSLLYVVNSTASVKAVKVRFLEGKDSREVLDFNLFLSAFDVWTAGIIPDTTAGSGKLVTFDKSCTIPPIPAGGKDFVNFAYVGSAADGADQSLDRTKEGYVEIIEMATYTTNSTVGVAATHVSGVPPCSTGPLTVQAASQGNDPAGGLFGGMSLINVDDGTDYTEDAVAIDHFSSFPQFFSAGSINPNLNNAVTGFNGFLPFATSLVIANNAVYQSTWGPGAATPFAPTQQVDAVSAVLMHDNVLNQFVLDSGTNSGTDWVVTFPTKRFYINANPPNGNTGPAVYLFQRNFNGNAGSCDDVSIELFDREEFKAQGSFSPPPPTSVNSLCWEANVVTFNNSQVLDSKNVDNIPTTFQNGWADINFFPSTVTGTIHKLINQSNTTITGIGGITTTGNSTTYNGLPLIGFEVEVYKNNTLIVSGSNVLSDYGGNFDHKTTTLVTLPPT
jgi:hypothetical protein